MYVNEKGKMKRETKGSAVSPGIHLRKRGKSLSGGLLDVNFLTHTGMKVRDQGDKHEGMTHMT